FHTTADKIDQVIVVMSPRRPSWNSQLGNIVLIILKDASTQELSQEHEPERSRTRVEDTDYIAQILILLTVIKYCGVRYTQVPACLVYREPIKQCPVRTKYPFPVEVLRVQRPCVLPPFAVSPLASCAFFKGSF